mgnify:CR=1 FL=1
MIHIKHTIKKLLSDGLFYKDLGVIAAPIIIQNFISTSLNMVDTIMIGMVGETQIAAVGIANQVFMILCMFLFGICSGCGIFISQFWGKRDKDNIKRVVGLELSSTLLISLILTFVAIAFPREIISIFNTDPDVLLYGSRYLRLVCLCYVFTAVTFCFSFALRCIERAAYPMYISAAALLTNTYLNYVFIFGHFGFKAMGVEGAALATVIARVIEAVSIVTVVYKKNKILAPGFKHMFLIDSHFFKRIYRTTIPVLLNEICWGLATVVYSVAFGRIGKEAIASVQISNTMQQMFMILCFGIANASGVMIGKRIGAGNEEEGRDYAHRFAVLSIASGIFIGIMMALSGPFILKFFKVSQVVMMDTYRIILMHSVIMAMRVFNIVLIVGVLRGGGDANRAFAIEASTMWFIGVPAAFAGALLFKLPIYWVIALTNLEEAGKFIFCLQRLVSGKWINNLVKNF